MAGQKTDTSIPVEEIVFARLGLANLKARPAIPPLFPEFCEKLLPKLMLPPTASSVLAAFSSPDVSAEKLADCIRGNPYYEYQFLSVFQSLSKREDQPSIEAAIPLLGMQNSRNLILALQALRLAQNRHPAWGADGKIQVNPADVLKYALQVEELLAKDKSGYAETAYAAAYIFDILVLAAEASEVTDPKATRAYIETVFNHGLQAAKIAVELAKPMTAFAYRKYAFGAALIHDIGKGAMAILSPEYPQFVAECAKREIPRAVRYFAEIQKYGISHAALGGLICRNIGVLEKIELAIACHHESFLLKAKHGSLHQLSAVVSLASNMAAHSRRPTGTDDPVIQAWRGVELDGFVLDPKHIVAAAQKAAK